MVSLFCVMRLTGAVERPVEEDAGRLAAEARIVLLREARGRLLSGLGQLGAAVEPRPGPARRLGARRRRLPDVRRA